MVASSERAEPRYWEEGHLSFAGAAFMGVYNAGVGLAFLEFAPKIAQRKVLGVSSGALASLMFIPNAPFIEGIKAFARLTALCRSLPLSMLTPGFNPYDSLRADLHKHLPTDSHVHANGKLHISLTKLSTLRNVVVSEFADRDELIEVVLASSFIPIVLSIVPPKVRGVRYIDGGFTDNLLVHDENTITVSPFTGSARIRPESWMPNTIWSIDNVFRIVRAMFAPSPKTFEDLARQGYRDGLNFIRQHGLCSCRKCALLKDRPRQGDCSACGELLERLPEAELSEELLRPLREAQKAEDAMVAANPFQYGWIMHTMKFLAAVLLLPLNIALSVSTQVYNGWPGIVEEVRGWLSGGYNAIESYARWFLPVPANSQDGSVLHPSSIYHTVSKSHTT